MRSYQNRSQIQQNLQQMLPYQIEECKNCDQLPQQLESLIKHNFQASFVCYDKKTNCIEIGVEEHEAENSYPEITVHKIKLEEAVSYLRKSFRKSDQDLKFYGKLLARNGANEVDEIVLV